MKNNKMIYEKAQQIINNTSIQTNKSLQNLTYDRTRYGTVVSYNILTNLARITLDGDDTEIPDIKNLSGAYLKTGDRIILNKVRGDFNAAYIDKNITSPNNVSSFTFTPIVAGSSTNGTISYTRNKGIYQRIGNVVTFKVDIQVNSISIQPTGDIVVKNFPFTASSSIEEQIQNCYITNINYGGNMTNVSAMITSGVTFFTILVNGTSQPISGINANSLSNGSRVQLSGNVFI